MTTKTSAVATASRVLAWIAGLLMLLAAVLVSLDVLARNLLASTFFESFELSTYAFAISVTLGLSYALTSKAHIRIEVVYNLLPSKIRVVLDFFAIASLAAAASVLFWFASQTVLDSYDIGARSNTTLGVPMVVPQGIWLAGLGWFAVTAFWLAGRAVANVVRGRPGEVAREIGVAALQEEIDHNSRNSEMPAAGALAEGK